MKRFWEGLKRFLGMGLSLAAALALVVRAPAVAIGFMGVRACKHVKDDYLKILVAAAASVLAAVTLMNFAEVAVFWTALGIADALNEWGHMVETA